MSATLQDIVKFRALVQALIVRHLAMRYRGSALGFLWSFLNPLCLMAVYVLVFRYYIRLTEVENYTLFVFVGLLPWLWTVSALSEGVVSITGSGHLVTKSMFPALILPFVSVATTLVHFLLSLLMLFLYMVLTGAPFHLTMLCLPGVVLLQALFLFGLVLALASLNVRFRDVQHVLGNVLTLLFFLSPILYPLRLVPEPLQFSLSINPFALFTTWYHRILIDGTLPSLGEVGTLLGFTCVALYLGVTSYNATNERFAELL